MQEVKLKDGFTVSVDEKALDDYELLEDLAEIDGGNGARVISAINRLFGEEVEALKEHLRENGRVSTQAMIQALMEVIQGLKAKKS